MFQYFVRRFLLIIPTFLACTIVVFTILQVTPGGPFEMAMLQAQARSQGGGEAGGGGGGNGRDISASMPESAKEEMKRYFGLDKPVYKRYWIWLTNMLQGDFGNSHMYGEPALDVIVSKFPISIYFGLIGFILTYIVCIPLGIYKAVKHSSAFDLASSALIFISYSIPGWALGAVLLVILGGEKMGLGIVPLGGFRSPDWDDLSFFDQILDQLHHTILPVICYAVGSFAGLTVLMKNSLMENLGADYVRTAFAKGLSERRVLFVHALRNSLIPIATGLGHALSLVLVGSFFIEKVFNIDGFGMLGYKSAINRDYTVVMAITVISVLIQLTGNIFSDMLYAAIDPRIRFR